jgi:hypothetical protein
MPCRVKAMPSVRVYAARAKIREEANRARGEAAKKQHEVSNPRIGEVKPVLVVPQSVGLPKNKTSEIAASLGNACTTEPEALPSLQEPKNKGASEKASILEVNRGAVERAATIHGT